MIKLVTPDNNAIVSYSIKPLEDFYNTYKKQQKLIKDDYKLIDYNWNLETHINCIDYLDKSYKYFCYKPIEFKFESNHKCLLILSLDNKFKNIAFKKRTNKGSVEVFNLLRNTTYFWKVKDLENGEESEIRKFKTKDLPRAIKIGKLFNLRDFGGYTTKHGKRIKQNLLIRGIEIEDIPYTDYGEIGANQYGSFHTNMLKKKERTDFKKFMPRGIDIDLRRNSESNFRKASSLDNFGYYHFETTYAYEEVLLKDDPLFIKQYRELFEVVSRADECPIYLHCWGGADRTGTFCFLLGALLGMSYTDLVIEFELTTLAGNPRSHYDKNTRYSWVHYIEFIQELQNIATENSLDNNLDTIVEFVLINRFKVSKETIERIRNTFLF